MVTARCILDFKQPSQNLKELITMCRLDTNLEIRTLDIFKEM